MSNGPAPIRVLIVEDHTFVRESLEQYVGSQPDMEVAGATGSAEVALQLVQEKAPNVVLLDMVLDDDEEKGLRVLENIRVISPSTHVVVLSAYSDDKFVFPAYRGGMIGYILKYSPAHKVIEAVRDAAAGHYHLDTVVAHKIVEHLLAQNGQGSEPKALERLTSRERDVLHLLRQDKSNPEIAQALTITLATVKTHVSNILRKLNLRSRHELDEWWKQQSMTSR